MMKLQYKIWSILLLTGILVGFTSALISDHKPGQVISVDCLRGKFLYAGVANPIGILIGDVSQKDIALRVDLGTVVLVRPGEFTVQIDTMVKETFLHISRIMDGDTIEVLKYKIRVKKVPDPVTYIAHVRHEGVILKENLQNVTGIFTRMENFDFDCAFKPQSFSMSVIEDGEWKEYKATGPELTPEMKTALTRAEEDDKIIFHNVMTKGPLEDVRKVNNVVITVK